MDNRIVSVEALPGYRLRWAYADGEVYELDYGHLLTASDWTRELLDPALFAAVQVGACGASIEWPNGYDNCADALRLDGELARRGLTRADLPAGD